MWSLKDGEKTFRIKWLIIEKVYGKIKPIFVHYPYLKKYVCIYMDRAEQIFLKTQEL